MIILMREKKGLRKVRKTLLFFDAGEVAASSEPA